MSYTPKSKRREFYLQQLRDEGIDVSGAKEYNYKKSDESLKSFSPSPQAQLILKQLKKICDGDANEN